MIAIMTRRACTLVERSSAKHIASPSSFPVRKIRFLIQSAVFFLHPKEKQHLNVLVFKHLQQKNFTTKSFYCINSVFFFACDIRSLFSEFLNIFSWLWCWFFLMIFLLLVFHSQKFSFLINLPKRFHKCSLRGSQKKKNGRDGITFWRSDWCKPHAICLFKPLFAAVNRGKLRRQCIIVSWETRLALETGRCDRSSICDSALGRNHSGSEWST